MTGEMNKADVTREDYPLHFAIADALGGTVEPFDVYQGPYVSTTANGWAWPVRLFIGSDDGATAYVWNETARKQSKPFLYNGPLAEREAVARAWQVARYPWRLSEIRAANDAAGRFFFSRDTMRFFGDTMRSFAVSHGDDGTVYVRRVRPMRDRNGRNMGGVGQVRVFDWRTGDISVPIREEVDA